MPSRRPHKLTVERLRDVVDYQPDTGNFYWRVSLSNRAPKGSRAGSVKAKCGHGTLSIDGRHFPTTTLAWAWMTGEFPMLLVDHRNGDPRDDRWDNLRIASYAENAMNARRHKDNKSGFKGVHLHKGSGKWCAQLRVRSRRFHLGLFETAEAAHSAYLAAATAAVGEFAKGG